MEYTKKMKTLTTAIIAVSLCIIAWIGYEVYSAWTLIQSSEDAGSSVSWNILFAAPVIGTAVLIYYAAVAMVSGLAAKKAAK